MCHIIILGPPIVWIVVGCVLTGPLVMLVVVVIVIVCIVVMRYRRNKTELNGKNL